MGARITRMVVVVVVAGLFGLGGCAKKNELPRRADGSVDRGPIIDSHTLITPLDESIDETLKLFERLGIVKFCNKNGGPLGSRMFAATVGIKHRLKEKFEFFANVSWQGVEQPGWGEMEAARFEQEVRYGAKGIKFFKAMGLGARDAAGKLIPIDDARFDPIMAAAARLNGIIALHVGDPVAFFKPPTAENERYDELKIAPDWSFYGGDNPKLMELWAQAERLMARHPQTTFLLIHLGLSEDLAYMEKLLDAHPNIYVDTSARVPEFGRKPVAEVRRFFTKFQDRILFGTDLAISPGHMQLGSVSATPPTFDDAVKFYATHFRYFETADQNFDHPTPIQGHWKISGIHLPAPQLRKLYFDNAEKLIFQRRMTVPVVDPLDAPPAQPAAAPASAPRHDEP